MGGTVNTIVMAMCAGGLRRFLAERNLLPAQPLIAAVPVSLRVEGNDDMNNQVSMVRVDLATDLADPAARFAAIHTSSEAAKAVVRELKPVLGVDLPFTGSPWVMTSLASLYGRSNLARRLPPLANVTISNVPGPAIQLYVAGARMVAFYPVSIPYHGTAVNITVQSYAGTLEFGITACRRALSQDESSELLGYLQDALAEIKRLPAVDDAAGGGPPADAVTAAAPARKKPAPRRASASKSARGQQGAAKSPKRPSSARRRTAAS